MKAQIPFDQIARFPLPGAAVPTQVSFGPDDKLLTYLYSPELTLVRKLFALDLTMSESAPVEVVIGSSAASEEELSLEERLRRERAREVGLGVTSVTWAEEADVLMAPLPQGVFVVRGLCDALSGGAGVGAADVSLAVGTDDGAAIEDPRLSPDGSRIAFVREGDIYVWDSSNEAVTRVTETAEEGLFNGLAEFIAQEEMSRDHGMWWSHDGRMIAYAEVDERHIPVYRIAHQGSEGLGGGTFEDHRYPFTGERNAIVRLGVVPAGGGRTVWMNIAGDGDGRGADIYLARVHWLPDGGLVAEVEARDQKSLRLYRFDPETGAATLLFTETGDPWLNLHEGFRALRGGEPGRFLWMSERTGWRHLELRSAEGDLERVLTAGEWAVDQLNAVDEERGVVYFSAGLEDTTEKQLYRVSLEGGEISRLTPEAGVHEVVIGRKHQVLVDTHSALDRPYEVVLRSLADGSLVRTIPATSDPRVAELDLDPPRLFRLPGADGTELNALLFEPQLEDGAAGSAPPPLLVHVYGGPHVQLVQNAWRATVMMRCQAMSRLGFTVLTVDNRGSARRGHAFEAGIYRNLGDIEVQDQVAGVRWAVEQGLADPDRVGVEGWSYGGYMSLMCLARAPRVFKAAVAGAPVTHQDGYDTHYTERYMSTPADNPEGYEVSSVLAHAGSIKGELMIVHGLIDENVHFRHTARLINRLITARVPYVLLLFPEERHLPRRLEDRAYMEETVINWLLEALS